MSFLNIPLQNVLFLDIETVSEKQSYEDLTSDEKLYWDQKSEYARKGETVDEFYSHAGIWAEFGKIICISVGFFTDSEKRQFRIKSFYGHNEVQILTEFKVLLESYFDTSNRYLCAHNGKEFDFPYIARRMIINGIFLPKSLQLFGKKPWEINHLDTLELWRFGDYKHYTSLKLLTHILGIPSPKDDIDGSEVYGVYYEEKNLSRIVKYCEKDTIAVAQVFLRFRGELLLEETALINV